MIATDEATGWNWSALEKEPEDPARPLPTLAAGLGRLTPTLVESLSEDGIQLHILEKVGEASERARAVAARTAIVGIHAPGGGPFSFLESLSRTCPKLRILFLADGRDPSFALAALRCGADDIIPPPHSSTSIGFRLRLLHSRAPSLEEGGWFLDATNGGARLEVDRRARMVTTNGEATPLTSREFQLFDRLLRERGGVVTRAELLRDLWGEGKESSSVLDATIHRLRTKLERDPAAPSLIVTVRGIGYRLSPPAQATVPSEP